MPATTLLQVGIEVTPIESPSHPLAREFLALWRARRDAGQPITRAELPSRPLLRYMPYLIVFEPLDDGLDWRFRLVGTEIRKRFGIEPTGLTIHGVYAASDAEHQAAVYRRLAHGTEGNVTRGRMRGPDRAFYDIEFCNLPLPGRHAGERWLMTGVFPPP